MADCTSAALPTLASGELASTVTLTDVPDAAALTVGSEGAALLGLEGLLLPPHAEIAEPTAAMETT